MSDWEKLTDEEIRDSPIVMAIVFLIIAGVAVAVWIW